MLGSVSTDGIPLWNQAPPLRYNPDMELPDIVAEICAEADDFLAGVTKRDEAKAGISEFLTIRHATLAPCDRQLITDQAMRVLDNEDFFNRDAGGEE